MVDISTFPRSLKLAKITDQRSRRTVDLQLSISKINKILLLNYSPVNFFKTSFFSKNQCRFGHINSAQYCHIGWTETLKELSLIVLHATSLLSLLMRVVLDCRWLQFIRKRKKVKFFKQLLRSIAATFPAKIFIWTTMFNNFICHYRIFMLGISFQHKNLVNSIKFTKIGWGGWNIFHFEDGGFFNICCLSFLQKRWASSRFTCWCFENKASKGPVANGRLT